MNLFFPNTFNLIRRFINVPFDNNDERRIAQRVSPAKTVLSGPFQGLQYPDYISYGSALIPKFLGVYEKELHPWIVDIISKRYAKIINIGCAEGYYAIGFAMRIPESQIWALDISFEALRDCEKMAKANHVENRLHILKMPNVPDLNKLLVKNTFIFCDCEGDEALYFNPKKFPELATCSFLVELHEKKHPHEQAIFVENFRRTHTIKMAYAHQRQLTDVPIGLRPRVRGSEKTVLNEFRNDGYTWMYAQPKHTEGNRS